MATRTIRFRDIMAATQAQQALDRLPADDYNVISFAMTLGQRLKPAQRLYDAAHRALGKKKGVDLGQPYRKEGLKEACEALELKPDYLKALLEQEGYRISDVDALEAFMEQEVEVEVEPMSSKPIVGRVNVGTLRALWWMLDWGEGIED